VSVAVGRPRRVERKQRGRAEPDATAAPAPVRREEADPPMRGMITLAPRNRIGLPVAHGIPIRVSSWTTIRSCGRGWWRWWPPRATWRWWERPETDARRWRCSGSSGPTSPSSTSACPCWTGSGHGGHPLGVPGSRFIALTVYQGDEDVHRALQAGAQAYLLKNAPSSQLVAAIRAVHAGLRKIPPEVASLVSDRGPGPG